jgi:hypothetical protein
MMAHVAWIVVAVQLAAAAAHADPAEDSALAHLDRGVAAYRAGDFALAHTELAAASQLAPDRPNPYRWLALTEVELGDCRSALGDIERFLSRVPAGDPRVAEVVALRGRCVGTGTVSLESTPGGAAIRVDGGPQLATTPARGLAMRAGAHRITLDKAGFVPRSEEIFVRATGTTYATFPLTPATPATPRYRRWWLWAAVGAVAITTVGVTYELTRGADARLPPVTCDPSGCHP